MYEQLLGTILHIFFTVRRSHSHLNEVTEAESVNNETCHVIKCLIKSHIRNWMLPFPEGWASEEQVNSMPSPCPQIKGQIINRLSVWHAYTHVGTYVLDAT